MLFLNLTIFDANSDYSSAFGPDLYIVGKTRRRLQHPTGTKKIFRTQVKDNTQTPVFLYSYIYSSQPGDQDRMTDDNVIFLAIYDKKLIERDVHVGTCCLNLKDEIAKNYQGGIFHCIAVKNNWHTRIEYSIHWQVDPIPLTVSNGGTYPYKGGVPQDVPDLFPDDDDFEFDDNDVV
jgi:Ca2+-dependent lipid-binding protein